MSAHASGCGGQAFEEAGMADSQQIKEAEDKMGKAVHACREELAVIRTGRASPKLVEHLQVEYYGSKVPLNQIAGISVPEARQRVTDHNVAEIDEVLAAKERELLEV